MISIGINYTNIKENFNPQDTVYSVRKKISLRARCDYNQLLILDDNFNYPKDNILVKELKNPRAWVKCVTVEQPGVKDT